MKHPSNRAFYAYWDEKRDGERAPDRRDIEPAAIRELLGDIFVLSCEPRLGYPFRVAGTRVCALLDRDLKGQNFATLFGAASRAEITEILGVVSEELLAAVAGVTATARDGSLAHLELLLLPFNNRTHTPISLTGLLAPMQHNGQPLGEFALTSWRYMNHPPQRFIPRALKKLAIARGFMVYEGLR
ncbi:MAG: PAS domain-containing protein [Nitrobacter sp. 62-13]|uniref:PAS domain-containing protein n=1 Tax=Nitrobacter sp. 62-13 TaxID=1895797 RepID=UPI000963EC01|nr:PAS domain-containing protein [Nitrobacter sp. 62-13]OJU29437.1 MAG: PAS domain-containing protein [Nitrobacter sp. 62-13]